MSALLDVKALNVAYGGTGAGTANATTDALNDSNGILGAWVTFGNDWASADEGRGIAAELHADREAIIASFIPPQQTTADDLPVRTGSARLLGIADDARVAAHFAEQRAAIERMRADLPAALAKANVPLLPPTPSSATPAKPPGSGPE